jgi:hypothetical protein
MSSFLEVGEVGAHRLTQQHREIGALPSGLATMDLGAQSPDLRLSEIRRQSNGRSLIEVWSRPAPARFIPLEPKLADPQRATPWRRRLRIDRRGRIGI